MFIIELSIKNHVDSDLQIIIWWNSWNHENGLQDDVSARQMTSKNTISLCWRTMPLRGLGPKGARVCHSVCIVRQVLSKGQSYICFYAHKQKSGLMFFILDHSPCGHPFSLIWFSGTRIDVHVVMLGIIFAPKLFCYVDPPNTMALMFIWCVLSLWWPCDDQIAQILRMEVVDDLFWKHITILLPFDVVFHFEHIVFQVEYSGVCKCWGTCIIPVQSHSR